MMSHLCGAACLDYTTHTYAKLCPTRTSTASHWLAACVMTPVGQWNVLVTRDDLDLQLLG